MLMEDKLGSQFVQWITSINDCYNNTVESHFNHWLTKLNTKIDCSIRIFYQQVYT